MDHHHHGNEKRMADAVWGKGDGKESTSKNPCPNTEMSDAMSTQACYPHNPPSLAAAKRYQGKDKATMMQTEAPPFKDIVNYPTFVKRRGQGRVAAAAAAAAAVAAIIAEGQRRQLVDAAAGTAAGAAAAAEERPGAEGDVERAGPAPLEQGQLGRKGREPAPHRSDQQERKRKRKRSDKESPASAAADETKRGCVMCGRHNKAVTLPSQNKNVCTACDVTVWVHSASGLQIKWCKGCKNFKTWASFGSKGHLTKCLQCRDQQNKIRQNKVYAERMADNANGKEANVAHHSAIAARAKYDSICEQLIVC